MEEFYKCVLDNLPVCTIIYDKNGKVMYRNKAAKLIDGYEHEELLGLDRKEYLERLEIKADKDIIKFDERTLRTKDGVLKNVLLIGRSLGDEACGVSACGCAIDVTDYVSKEKRYLERLSAEIEERKKAEESLKASEDRFRSYIDKSPDGIFCTDESGRYQEVNPEGCAMIGYTPEELCDKSIPDIDLGGDVNFSMLKKSKGPVMVETELRRKDGTTFPVELKAVPLKNGCYVAYVRDISARKLVEKQLVESEEQYRLIFNNTPLGIFHFDQQGAITACNDRFVEILGSSFDKLIGFNMLRDLKDEEMKAAIRSALRGEIGRYKATYASATSGKRVPLEAVFRGIISEDGKLLGTVGIIEDISVKMRAEEALRRSEQYNDLIINGVSESLVLYEVNKNLDLRFLKVNDKFLNMNGFKEEEVIGKLIQEVLPENIAKEWDRNNKKIAEKGVPVRFEEESEYGFFEVNLIPIIDSHGKCTHLLSTAIDITERKKNQEYQMQTEKLHSIGLLAGGIAHDFNNILTIISGNISLTRLRLDQLGMDKLNNLTSLLTEAEKASLEARHLTQQLLTFAKGGEPVTKAVSIDRLIKETADFVLRGSKSKCDYDIPENLWPVEVDSGLISQVIQNLIINANQAMPLGGTITVSAKNMAIGETVLPLQKGTYVKVAIRDQGVGIPAKHLERIFDPYFTTKQAGNGLGLAIVHSIVTKHKGYIDVESEQGEGTVFNIYLPASRQRNYDERVEEKGAINGRGRILLMDDDQNLRQIVKEMLEHLGYDVVLAGDGLEALQLYKAQWNLKQPFDAVIMDLTIPGGIGGRETIKKLLTIDPDAKAIVASGYSNDPVMARYREYGFKDVVIKPFSMDELGGTLHRVLSSRI